MRKLQSLFFKGRMLIYGIWGLPAQTRKEIKIFKRVLDNVRNGGKIKIFEWGSGFSTIYYANYLQGKNLDFEWHIIDNNKVWHEKVKALVKKEKSGSVYLAVSPRIRVSLRKPDCGPIPPAYKVFSPKSESEMAYINFPRQLNSRFNVVIIDAQFRRHCIQTTKEVLLPEEIAILHLDDFRYGKFLNTGSWYPFQKIPHKVWIGSMGNSKIFETLNPF
jgi:hypothetical protein